MRQSIKRSAGYFLLLFALGLDMAVVGPTLADLAQQTGTTLGGIGLVFLLGAAAGTLGTMLGGWLFDRAGGRWILGLAELCSSVLVFLVPHTKTLAVLFALFVVKGVCGGLVNTGCNTLMVWTHGEKSAPFVNAMHFFFGLGAFLSPLLVGVLLKAGGTYPAAYHVLGLVEALVAVFVLVSVRAPSAPAAAPRATVETPAAGTVGPLVACAALYLFFYVSAELTYGGWVSTAALTRHVADPAGAAFLTSVFWLFFTCGRLISIPVAVRVHPARTIPVAMAGCGVFLLLQVIAPGSAAVLWITTAGTGLFMAPLWPSGFTLAGQSLHLTARRSMLILLGDSFGGMVLPGLTGLIMERAGTQAMARLVLASIGAAFLGYLGMRLFAGRRSAPGRAAGG